MIELKNLGKTFHSKSGATIALKNINLTIEDGDIYGIIGLSGAGKSTLVRCINLLERPTEGQVIVDGEDLTTVSKKRLLEIRKNIGMIFQHFNLLEQRNVLANVCLPLELSGVKKQEAIARAEELLNLVGLADKKLSYSSQLSGGQKQRVAIARALATSPKYLLCDEATSALDPSTTLSILNLLRDINKTLGVTVVIITHEMKIIEKTCTKVAIIDQSEIAECGEVAIIDQSEIAEYGDVAEVFSAPKSEIAKALILPDLIRSISSNDSAKKLRLIFRGEESSSPILSELILKCNVPANILFADTKNIDGKLYGHMVLTLPNSDDILQRATAFLEERNIHFITEDE